MSDLCMWCDKPATHYCDAPIGFEATDASRDKRGHVISLLTGSNGQMWTCDAPMCDEHAFHIGTICGDDPDSIDHCPHHQHEHSHMPDLVMFEREAEAKRREVHAAIKRLRIRNGNSPVSTD